ncbi:replication initiation protein [Niallia taxi]|uniref:RepB family plasmid replication initiator protein n=3 Tax=Bacillati TaxID=1783272 RepID=A0A3S2TQP3_9BACI|nr:MULTISPECIES: replication initiation protein [Bacteria]MDG8280191.1 replication initiation protein [Streptococcus pneumoniae]MCL1557712.1 replication initiation protein [Xanthomonas nasturtii]MCM3218180.1 replication initiation protein [Niallia taxi]MED4056954.1 replication initiation protein [Niallia taxi]MED4120280.1 replication initiation protein [Niallia taxi]
MGSKISADNLITKSNQLIEAAYKLNEIEQKIILTLISLVQPNDKEFQSYTFTIKDFIKLIGGNSNTRYKELEEITRNMLAKIYEIRFEERLVQVQWLSQADYNYKKGTIELTLHKFLTPYLLELKKEFTSYHLKNVSKLKGHYSIRIYELLKQYERLQERTLTMEDLRHKLGATSIYPAYGNFKQRVILPSQKQINKKSDITFEFQEIKQGRAVKEIKFFIKTKDSIIQPLPIPISHSSQNAVLDTEELENDLFVVSKDDIKDIKSLASDLGVKVPNKTIQSWLNYGKRNVIRVMESIRDDHKIENPIGFITYKLKNEIDKNIIEINPSDDAIQDFVNSHIPKRKIKRVEFLTDWMMKPEALKTFSKYMNEDDALDLWNSKKEAIMQELNDRRGKMILN